MSHADIRLDYRRAFPSKAEDEKKASHKIETLQESLIKTHRGMQAMKEMGQLPFLNLPYQEEEAQKILEFSQNLQQNFDTVVVLGIGGSALGAKALQTALKGPLYNLLSPSQRNQLPRLFICDSLDPDFLTSLFDLIDFKTTLFNVISKSGETLEANVQFILIEEKLKAALGAGWKKHVVITTDPEYGFLRKRVKEEGFQSLTIPPGVGGRFSVLSAVGLFPAAMIGIKIEELLSGARRMDTLCAVEDLWLNPAFTLAALQYLMDQQRKNILVLMPYSDFLEPTAAWYAQLWAESVGKRISLAGELAHTGSTPVIACGPRDQHSQLQLYMEGPADKFILFLRIENFQKPLFLPEAQKLSLALSYLGSKSVEYILQTEAEATAQALKDAGRASATLLIPHLNAYGMGQLLFLLEITTVLAGGLYNINPFDQPGVEIGKKIAQKVLGK